MVSFKDTESHPSEDVATKSDESPLVVANEESSEPRERINQVELAHRIRKLRVERGLTVEEASNRSSLTKSWWSKVENFRLTPSLPALFRVASVLGVSIAKLLEGLDARPPLVVVRPHERLKFRRDPEISNVQYESLAHPRPNRKMDPLLLTIEPHAERQFAMAHQGEEFYLILEGKLILEYGQQRVELSAGDSTYFDACINHRLTNPFTETAKVLAVQDTGGIPAVTH